MSIPGSGPCPCGLDRQYNHCCGRLHSGPAQAATAEALMRSRYSAFAVQDEAYLLRTWHSRTRPERLMADPGTRWIGLEIVGMTGGGMLEPTGTVEFRASYRRPEEGPGVHVQRGFSRFVRESGRWTYLNEMDETPLAQPSS